MRASLDDVCGCFPTGRHYPGIAERIARTIAKVVGLSRRFEPAANWVEQRLCVIDFETTGLTPETDRVIEHAREKLARKGCDWIVANDVSAEGGAMGGDLNTVYLVTSDGVESWPTQSKEEVARNLIARIAAALEARR